MSVKVKISLAFLLVALVGAGFYWWRLGAPRRESLARLTQLNEALQSGSRAELLNLVVIPESVRDRTAPEQSEFLAKALNDEISAEGLAVLEKYGEYGPLKDLFPTEAETWAARAGVIADDCVAFKLERHGVRAEVVLVKPSDFNTPVQTHEAYVRIVRLNNVKQMALPTYASTTEKNP